MKKIVLIALISLLSFPIFAQDGKFGADSANCVRNLSLYRDYFKENMFDKAYEFWQIAYSTCPASSERMYLDGITMMDDKIKNATSDEVRAIYIDSLFLIYDQRIENFGKEGYVLGRKGADMLRLAQKDYESAYHVLEKSIQLEGLKSQSGALVSYMNAAVIMEKNKKFDADSVVEVFSTVSEILDYNITHEENAQSKNYFERAQEVVEIIAGPYLSCEILVKMAEDNYEVNKDNIDWLNRTSKLLDSKNCTDEEVFFKIAQGMHEKDPSANSAYNMGVMNLKKNSNAKAVEYFKEAIDLTENEAANYRNYIILAQAYSNMASYTQGKTAALKAASIRPNEGRPYILIGNMIASSENVCKAESACYSKAVYWLAEDYFMKAKSIDPSVAEAANSRIATYKKYFPEKGDCFFEGIKEGDSIKIECWINESTKARF